MGLLRLLLAISVLAYHAGPVLGSSMLPGDYAVEVFFMISGFYMSLVLSSKYAGQGSLRSFYVNRLARLYPVYLLVVLVSWVWFFFTWLWLGKVPINGWLEPYREMDFFQRLVQIIPNWTMIGNDIRCLYHFKSNEGFLLFHYYHNSTAPDGATWAGVFGTIGQAWSIGSEIWFYLAAPWLARLKFPVLLAVGVIAMALKASMEYSGLPTYFFTPAQLGFFVIGMLAHRTFSMLPFNLAPPKLGWTMALVLALATVFFPWIEFSFSRWVYYIGFVVALPFVFSASKLNQFDRWVGNLSYPFYMTHSLAMSVVPAVIGKTYGTFPTLLATLFASIVIQRYVEDPVEKWRHNVAPIRRV